MSIVCQCVLFCVLLLCVIVIAAVCSTPPTHLERVTLSRHLIPPMLGDALAHDLVMHLLQLCACVCVCVLVLQCVFECIGVWIKPQIQNILRPQDKNFAPPSSPHFAVFPACIYTF
jgi:hypothetical protein